MDSKSVFHSDKREREVFTFDSELAQEALDHNHKNRNVSQNGVDRLARLMTEGKWMDNGEAIKFSSEGTLLDGQHRLKAIVQADVEVDLVVEMGIDPKAQETMDSAIGGSIRRARHHLQMKGIANSKTTAAALKLLYHHLRHGVSNYRNAAHTASEKEISDLFERFPEIHEHVQFAKSKKFVGLMPGRAVAFVRYIGFQIDEEFTREFFTALRDGIGLKPDTAVLSLREQLQRDSRRAKHRRKYSSNRRIAMLIKAFNKDAEGETVKMLTWPNVPGEDFPELTESPFYRSEPQ